MPSTPPGHTLLSRRTLAAHGARAGALLAAAIVPIAGVPRPGGFRLRLHAVHTDFATARAGEPRGP